MEKQFSCDIKNFVLSQSDCLSDEPFLIQLIFLTLVLYLQQDPANEQSLCGRGHWRLVKVDLN